MQETLYVETPSQTSTHIQGGEIYQMSPITNMTVRKDVLTSHQRVHTSVLVLNRKQNAFETHLTQC